MILSRLGRWRIVGVRNRIFHKYAEVNTEIVWATAQNEVRRLLNKPEGLMEESRHGE